MLGCLGELERAVDKRTGLIGNNRKYQMKQWIAMRIINLLTNNERQIEGERDLSVKRVGFGRCIQ